MTRLPIARRNGRPAWENAPPRMRASQINRPFVPMEDDRPGLLARLMGRGR